MLHDMAATQRTWDSVRAALTWSNTVCTWDARGHGASRGRPEGAVPTLGLLAADLDAAIEACAPECPVLVGHGLGALTILEHLRNYDSGRVARIVLVDQSPRMVAAPDWALGLFSKFDATAAQVFEAQIRANFADAWMRLQARAFAAAPGTEHDAHCRYLESMRRNLRDLANGSMRALWHSMVSRDYRLDLASTTLPVLAIFGRGSNLYDTQGLARWFTDSVPHAQVLRYPKADHAPHAAASARFARDVAAFAAQRVPKASLHPAGDATRGPAVPGHGAMPCLVHDGVRA
jgi:non-heme chloroperoxidase